MSVDATQGTWVGQGAYALGKLWIVTLPLAWLLWVDRGRISWSPLRRSGLLSGLVLGLALGLVLSAGIVAVSLLLGPGGALSEILGQALIRPDQVRARALQVGIGEPLMFLAFAAYLILVNSLVEEYVWRWFVFRKCEALLPAGRSGAAVLLAAAFFTLHHVVALRAQFDPLATILASTGVFAGGAIWSWCYRRYQSIWPGYVSHAIVDLALLWIGWRLIFGG